MNSFNEEPVNHFQNKNKKDLKFSNVTANDDLDSLVRGCDDSPVQELCIGCAYNCVLSPGAYRVSAPTFTICKSHGKPECGFPVYTGCYIEMKPPC